jgi:hypothetical protein
MAFGWRLLSVFGTGFLFKTAFTAYNANTYGPVVSAFLRKHAEQSRTDRFDITDRKREYYEIDTSQYMNYDFKDLGHNYHANHGPQPVISYYNTKFLLIGWRSIGQHMVS